jgi:hypothetical protein
MHLVIKTQVIHEQWKHSYTLCVLTFHKYLLRSGVVVLHCCEPTLKVPLLLGFWRRSSSNGMPPQYLLSDGFRGTPATRN